MTQNKDGKTPLPVSVSSHKHLRLKTAVLDTHIYCNIAQMKIKENGSLNNRLTKIFKAILR